MSSRSYDEDELLLVGPAAELVGVHPDTLRRWAAAGRVPVLRTPTNQRRFLVRDLRALIKPENTIPQPRGGDADDPTRALPPATAERGAA